MAKSTRRKTTSSNPSAGDGPAVGLITTKHRTYVLPAGQAGIPVRDYFPGVELPGPLAHAKIYETSGGPVAAIPEAVARAISERPISPKKRLRWGLIPGWWKKTAKEMPATFNARAESVAENGHP